MIFRNNTRRFSLLALLLALALAGNLSFSSGVSARMAVPPLPPGPTLGTYANTTVTAGGSATVTPSAAPTFINSAAATVASLSGPNAVAFQGVLTVNPTTGVVSISNAGPSGVYTVTVRGFGISGTATASFTLTVANGTACSNASFTGSTNVGVGTYPLSVAVGDFNGDGKLDFATANNFADTVSIRLGDGAGNFSGSTEVGVGSYPTSVAVGDFNGDGKLDFATANTEADTVSIRLGDGAGNFSGSTEVGVGSFPYFVAVGDFNGDGKLDFATANTEANTVSIRLGDGAGNFSGSTEVGVGLNPYSVAVGDFNGDGKFDFAVANLSADTVSIRLGDGAGNFSGSTDVGVGSYPYSVAVGDFNGDGKLDFASGSVLGNTVSIRLGDGAGNFSGSTEVVVGSDMYSVALGDFNGDGKLDFASANITSDTISIRLGDGAGNFSGSTELAAGQSPVSLALGDFNGDGKLDLASVIESANAVSIWLSNCSPLNTAPTITAGGSFTRQQGSAAGAAVQIAAVSDNETSAGSLTVTASTVPAGITVGPITNDNGAISATVAAACNATLGANTVTLTVSDGSSTATADFTVDVTANTSPTLGSYPSAGPITVGAGTTVTPSAAPADNVSVASVTVAGSVGFTGTLSVNPTSGVVTISNAGPAGMWVITVTATDDCGATTNSQFTLTVIPAGPQLGEFVVFSKEHTYLRANTEVFSGNVGANTSLPDPNGGADDKEEVEIGIGVKMLQAGSKVIGDTVRTRANSQIYNVHFNEEFFSNQGTILGAQVTPQSLPVLLSLPTLPAITPGATDVNVPANQTMTLAAGAYRNITVNHDATLILTGGVYHLEKLDIRQDAKLHFTAATEVRIKNEMDTDVDAYVGPAPSAPSLLASQIIFYCEGADDGGDLARTVVQIGIRNTVKANFYAPNGTVYLRANTVATGAFIGKRAQIGERVELTLKSAF